MRIRFTLSAEAQLKSAVDYIRRDRPTAAVSYFNKVKKRLKRLETFPNSGRRVPEFPERQIREIIIPPYRFFYQQRGKTIWILAVWHEAQLPDDPSTES